MFNTVRIIKYATLIGQLAQAYAEATTTMERSLVCMKANRVKSECAKLVLEGKMNKDTYEKMFKVGKTNANVHFLEVYVNDYNAKVKEA